MITSHHLTYFPINSMDSWNPASLITNLRFLSTSAKHTHSFWRSLPLLTLFDGFPSLSILSSAYLIALHPSLRSKLWYSDPPSPSCPRSSKHFYFGMWLCSAPALELLCNLILPFHLSTLSTMGKAETQWDHSQLCAPWNTHPYSLITSTHGWHIVARSPDTRTQNRVGTWRQMKNQLRRLQSCRKHSNT